MTRDQEKTEKKIRQLAARADQQGIAKLKAEEQVAVLAYWARGAIGHDGIAGFYESPVRLDTLVDALRVLGLQAQAEAALATAQQFPDPAFANDPDARYDHLAQLETEEQDRVFYKLSWEELYDAIAAYWKTGSLN